MYEVVAAAFVAAADALAFQLATLAERGWVYGSD